MSRRVVFLDLDGCLNTFGSTDSSVALYEHEGDFATLLDSSIQALNDLVQASDAQIVITSSWRKTYSLPQLQQGLAARGLLASVVGVTPALWQDSAGRMYRRGDEIAAWLSRNLDVTGFVILDDETDMGRVSPWLVRVRSDVGLTREDAEVALPILYRGLAEHPIPEAVAVLLRKSKAEPHLYAAVRSAVRNGGLGLPGGKIDPGELTVEAALRELYEETGLGSDGWVELGTRCAVNRPSTLFVGTGYAQGELVSSHEGEACWATELELVLGYYGVYIRWAFARARLKGLIDGS